MNEKEDEAPLEDPCIRPNRLARERHAARSKEQHATNASQRAAQRGARSELPAAIRRLRQRSPPLRLHASPKWLREKLHSRRAAV